MALDIRSINKLLREDFSEANPMVVAPDQRESLGEAITEELSRIEGIDTKAYHYVSEAERERLVCTFSLLDPDAYYFHNSRSHFRLVLNETMCSPSRPNGTTARWW